MARTPEVEITEAVAPAARVHDTYVRPETPAESPLHEVARSLGNFNSKIGALFDTLDAEDKKTQEAQAVADFYAGNQEGAAKATRDGTIPTFANPHYTNMSNKLHGEAEGMQLEGKLGVAYSQSNIKTSADPEAYDKWFNGAIKETMGNVTNPGVLRGLAPHVHSLNAKFRAQHTKDRSEYVSGVAVDRTIKLSGTIIDRHLVDGATQPEGYDIDAMGQNLEAVRKTAYDSGMERGKVNKLLIDTITGKALMNTDEKLLDLLDRVKDEKGLSLAETDDGKLAKFKYTKEIQGIRNAEETRAGARQAKADVAKKNAMTADFFQQLRKNPNHEPSEKWLRDMEVLDPDFTKGIAASRQALLDAHKVQDPRTKMEGLRAAYAGQGKAFIEQAFKSGDLKDPAVFDAIMEATEKHDKLAAAGSPHLLRPDVKFMKEQITTRGKDMKFPGAFGGPSDALVPAAREALDYIDEQTTKYFSENPKATEREQADFVKNLRERVLDNYKLPEMATDPAPEQRPSFTAPGTKGSTDLSGKPVAPEAAAPRVSPVTQQAPTPPPKTWVDNITDSPTPPKIGTFGMPKDREDRIRAEADKRKVDPQTIIDTMHRKLQSLKEQGVIKRPAPSGGPVPAQPGAAPSGPPRAQKPDGPPAPLGEDPPLKAPEKRSEVDIPGYGKFSLAGLPEEAVNYIRQAGLTVTDTQEASPAQVAPTTTGQDTMAGSLSAKHEVGSGNSSTIAHDSTGGWSYGRKQFAAGGTTANGAAMVGFIKVLKADAPELAAKLEAAGGASAAKAGTPEFKAAWKAASTDPRFPKAEDLAAKQQLVEPGRLAVAKSTGLDVDTRSKAVQEVLYSTAVQHGGSGAGRLWKNALKGKDPASMSDAEIINALYDERSKVTIYFRSSTPAIQRSVANRFKQERRDALAMLKGSDANIA